MSFDIPFARAVLVAMACAGASLAQAAGPSFDCARATSDVNRTICGSPELSALDRQLSEHYRALLAQPGADAAGLAREEAQWLRDVRNPCPDAACIRQAYTERDAALVARTRRLAGAAAAAPADGPDTSPSPAAAAETVPFVVDAGLFADARALRAHACAAGEDLPKSAGFAPVPGASPVVSRDGVVLERRHAGADFAFLLDTRRGACRIVDVVALPPHAQVGNLLQCLVPADDGSATPLSAGIGLRRAGQKAPVAYWEVDVAHGLLIRQPLGVLDWSDKVRCQEPEVGD